MNFLKFNLFIVIIKKSINENHGYFLLIIFYHNIPMSSKGYMNCGFSLVLHLHIKKARLNLNRAFLYVNVNNLMSASPVNL